jgi:hypothetical protein
MKMLINHRQSQTKGNEFMSDKLAKKECQEINNEEMLTANSEDITQVKGSTQEQEPKPRSKRGRKSKTENSDDAVSNQEINKGSNKKLVNPASSISKDEQFYSENPVLARKDGENEWLAVCIHGHSQSKVVIGRLGDLKPYQLELKPTALMMIEGDEYLKDGFFFKEAPKEYRGKSFVREGRNVKHLMSTTNEGKVKHQLALTIDSLWESIRESDTIHYVGAVHLEHWDTKIFDSVNGTHTVETSDEEKTFTITPYRICPEGSGVITYYKLTNPNEKFTNAYVYDFGDGTSIGTYFEGSRAVSSRAVAGTGFRQVAYDLGSNSALLRELDSDSSIDYFEIIDTVKKSKNGKYTLRNKDVTNQFNDFFTKRANELISEFRNAQENQYRNSQICIATGGALLVPAIRKVFQKEGFKIVADPVWADAIGIYKRWQHKIKGEGVKPMSRPEQSEESVEKVSSVKEVQANA